MGLNVVPGEVGRRGESEAEATTSDAADWLSEEEALSCFECEFQAASIEQLWGHKAEAGH